jgi:signal transduction histidine kinase
MMTRPRLVALALLAVLVVPGAWPATCPAASPYLYKETRALVAKVQEAALLVSREGEKAFAEFRAPDGPWFKGERYLFVVDLDGNTLVNAAFPELEGKNVLDLADPLGRRFIRAFIREVDYYPGKDSGWVHYTWPRPGEHQPVWKSVYVKLATAPDGKKYVVGGGKYQMRIEPQFAQDAVEEAALLINKVGAGAFEALRDQAGPFRFRDTYVWVADDTGTMLCNPGFPAMEGKNYLDLKDRRGRYPHRDYIRKVRQKGQGWVVYLMRRPGHDQAVKKMTYVKGVEVDGETWVVGCGIYLD